MEDETPHCTTGECEIDGGDGQVEPPPPVKEGGDDDDDDNDALAIGALEALQIPSPSFDSSGGGGSIHDQDEDDEDDDDDARRVRMRRSLLGTTTRTEIDTSETPRAALTEGALEMDFEILPDDEEDDDDEDDDDGGAVGGDDDLDDDNDDVNDDDNDDDDDDDNHDDNHDDGDHDDAILLSESLVEASKEEVEFRQQLLQSAESTGVSPPSGDKINQSGSHDESSGGNRENPSLGGSSRRRLRFLQKKNPLSPRPAQQRQRQRSPIGGGDSTTPGPARVRVAAATSPAAAGTQAGTSGGNSNFPASGGGATAAPPEPGTGEGAAAGGENDTGRCKQRGNRFIPRLLTRGGGASKDSFLSPKSEPPPLQSSQADNMMAGGGAAGGGEEQDSSSDESSYDDDEHWLEGESQIFEDDIDQVVDLGTLTNLLPNSFLNLPPDIYDYLDSDLVKDVQNQDISTFAWDHHLFVKGLLQLLAERDLIGVEDNIHDARNVSKMGVLRKKHAKSGWHVKYVEVRTGNLTFFADKESEKRRTVHLRKRTCSCRASTKEWGGDDLVFELIVDGGKRLLWMAKSEEECQGWIKAINQAMIGDTVDTRDVPLDMKMYQTAIDAYQSVRSSLRDVETRQEYLVAMNTLLYRQTSSSALRVPMKWIRQSVILDRAESDDASPSGNDRVKATVREFWNNLCNTSVVLNGYLVEANSTYSGERVIGALCRCILEFDKVENEDGFQSMFNSLKPFHPEAADSFITEVQAVSYARNILSGALRSKNRGDAQTAVEELFRNDDVVQVKLESSEPLHIDVSFAGDDFSENEPRPTGYAGWIETKPRRSKNWKKWYFVASEGVLSYFERADPRPYGLRGQVVLREAKITILEGNTLVIETEGKERELRFEDRGELIKWKGILMGKSEDGQMETEHGSRTTQSATTQEDEALLLAHRRARSAEEIVNGKPLKVVREAGAILLRNAADGVGGGFKAINRAKAHANRAAVEGMKLARHATGAGMRSVRETAGMFIRGVRGGSEIMSLGAGRRRPTNDMLISSTQNLATRREKREPTVQAVVEVNYLFKVVSTAGEDNKEDVLLIVRVKLYQAFLLSGGPNGRLASGDELLLMEFSKGDNVEEVQHEFLELPTSL